MTVTKTVNAKDAEIEGLEQLLTDELGIHTVIANPFNAMTFGASINENALAQVAPQLTVATGLALRSFTPWHI